MKVPLLDLKAQYAAMKDEVDAAVRDVIERQQFVLGDKGKELEEQVAGYVGTEYAVGVASGTDAILLSLRALGIGAGNEVITTGFSFFATAGAIVNVGATPVLIDIDPKTFNIDPALIERAITDRTRAILPAHIYGQGADMEPIVGLAEKHGLTVIEDAAQAIGAKNNGRSAGSMGDCGCLSFYPTKNLGAYGDGGMVVTSDPQIAETLRMLRDHGSRGKYEHELVGTNSRLDELQAAVLLAKLPHLDEWSDKRRRNAAYYDSKLADLDGVETPHIVPDNVSVYNCYTIRVRERDRVAERLQREGIGCAVHYPRPLPLQGCFDYLGYKAGDLPDSERASKEVLSIPMYPELSQAQMDAVVGALADALESL
jgi:dTDP-4-amino-4,6-dideoxygalactose transaminase